MVPRYSGFVTRCQTLPLLWLLSDARNDARLEAALARLPHGSGFVFRHYHLPASERRSRFDTLARLARQHGHVVVLAGYDDWGADGVYGERRGIGLHLAAAHDGTELQAAMARAADAVFLSPVFPTQSHPGGPTLGVHGFHVLAQQASVPVIALGGMTAARANELDWPRWGAIDGLG